MEKWPPGPKKTLAYPGSKQAQDHLADAPHSLTSVGNCGSYQTNDKTN